MRLNKQQLEIDKTFRETNKNIMVRATAGAGKTSTLVALCENISKIKKALFLAFNNSIVKELQERLPNHVKCSTLHSQGVKYIYRYYGTAKLVNLKSFQFSDKHIKKIKKVKNKFATQLKIEEILQFTRMNMISDYNLESVLEVCDIYGINASNEVIEASIATFKDMDSYNNKKSHKEFQMDFVDMVYLPASKDFLKTEKFDYVMVDEFQDMSMMGIALIEKLVKEGGKTVFVGDKNQMLYLFAGSSMNAYDKGLNRPNTVELPLSVTYRCAKNIVDEARKIYPVIESHPKAEKGIVRGGSELEIKEGDMVLCRENAPLMELCGKLIDRGLKVSVYGKSIENSAKSIVKKYKGHSINTFLDKIWDELLDVQMKLQRRGVSKPERHKSSIAVQERNEILDILSEKVNTVSELGELINEIFCEKKESVRLMSIHVSKGLESERVFFLKQNLIPHKYAESPEEMVQEQNLKFVAITRAKKELVYID